MFYGYDLGLLLWKLKSIYQIYFSTVSNVTVKRVMQIRIYSKKWRGNDLNHKILPSKINPSTVFGYMRPNCIFVLIQLFSVKIYRNLELL